MPPLRREWKRNGTVRVIIDMIKEETQFQTMSFWDTSWGGAGYYVWGYGTRAPGPGASITPEMASAELAAGVRTAIDEFSDVFQFCPTPICECRTFALIRLLFYMGLPRFMRMHGMIKAIFRGNWAEAAYQLRSNPWYDDNGQKARRIAATIRDGTAAPLEDNGE